MSIDEEVQPPAEYQIIEKRGGKLNEEFGLDTDYGIPDEPKVTWYTKVELMKEFSPVVVR